MNRVLRLAFLLPLIALLLCAADVSGTWKGNFDYDGTDVPVTFNLKTVGSGLTGTVEGLPTTPAEIHDGKVEGDKISFSVTIDYQGQNVKLVYEGKVDGGRIDFKFGTEDGSWGTELTSKKAS
jgi:hypothetical protein